MSTLAIGRAGRDASTLMIAEDANHVFAIERFSYQKITRVKLKNFDYRHTALFEQDKPGAKSGYTGSARAASIPNPAAFTKPPAAIPPLIVNKFIMKEMLTIPDCLIMIPSGK